MPGDRAAGYAHNSKCLVQVNHPAWQPLSPTRPGMEAKQSTSRVRHHEHQTYVSRAPCSADPSGNLHAD
ncbi:hypothetical protein E5D57_000073 [Metarhizium anisopliae]|nr:hypothetical protein E5D57_000073 [Metarhizium anisopliae]